MGRLKQSFFAITLIVAFLLIGQGVLYADDFSNWLTQYQNEHNGNMPVNPYGEYADHLARIGAGYKTYEEFKRDDPYAHAIPKSAKYEVYSNLKGTIQVVVPQVQALIAQLKDTDPSVVASAQSTLIKVGGDPIINALIDAAIKDDNICSAVVDTLVKMGEPAIDRLINTALSLGSRGLERALANTDNKLVIDKLKQAMEDGQPRIRSAASDILSSGKLKDDPEIQKLLLHHALYDPDPSVRNNVRWDLIEIDSLAYRANDGKSLWTEGSNVVDSFLATYGTPQAAAQHWRDEHNKAISK